MTDVRAFFVIPEEYEDETQCSEDMHSAFKACRDNGIIVEWVKDCRKLAKVELKKTDIVVLDKFSGVQFETIKNTKATRIVGVLCLLVCLLEGHPIPNVSWPILNMAMSSCIIAMSNISKSTKEKLKQKIQWMGGKVTDGIFEINTHLVTDSVKTEKYLKAAELGMKLMKPSWIEAVWEVSQSSKVHCNDDEFDQHRCPAFNNLTITSTGFTILEEREKIKRLITENGGIYMGQLDCSRTDVLICKGQSTSDKYKVARKSGRIKCVTMDWLIDSVQKGYALKEDCYTVKKSTSTPTKTGETINPDFSIMSAISSTSFAPQSSVLQETINSTISNSNQSVRKRKSSQLNEVNDIIDGIDIKAVKRAGSFLDGCCVFLAGFSPEQRERVSRILNLGGSTRYDQLSDRITHVIIGDPTLNDVRVLNNNKQLSVPVISLEWLCECIRRQMLVEEDDYLVQMKGSSDSPISQKGLKLLRRELSKENVPTDIQNNDTTVNPDDVLNDINSEILQQYLNTNLTTQDTLPNASLPHNPFANKKPSSSKALFTNAEENDQSQVSKNVLIGNPSISSRVSITDTEDETGELTMFSNIKVLALLFDEDEMTMIRDCIETYGGELLLNDSSLEKNLEYLNSYDVNLIVVPAFNNDLKQVYKTICDIATTKGAEIVTEFFITQCHHSGELVPVEYYHKPVFLKNETDEEGPLKGKVITISSYAGTERAFLGDLANRLGAIYQEQLCRTNKGQLKASTHLVNLEPSGKKYEAAVKWGLPVITKDWLLDTAKSGKWEWEGKYLVGDAKAPRPQPEDEDSEREPNSEVTLKDNTNHQSSSKTDLEHDSKQSSKSELDDQDSAEKNLSGTSSSLKENIPNVNVQNRIKKDINVVNADNDDSFRLSNPLTPIKDIVKRFEASNKVASPSTPPLYKLPNEVDTPETPYGAFLKSNPSPRLKKECLNWINSLPYGKARRLSTPFSELKRKLWSKITSQDHENRERIEQPNFDVEESPNRQLNESISQASNYDALNRSVSSTNISNRIALNANESRDTPTKAMIDNNLKQLQEILSSTSKKQGSLMRRKSNLSNQECCSEGAVELKSSQAAGTVGWEYSQLDKKQVDEVRTQPVFMLSSIENKSKQILIKQIQELGGTVSDLQHYDPKATHLLAPKAQRTEKMLCCMASGKWILHPSFIENSAKEKQFVNMEHYEFGNPLAKKDIIGLGNEAVYYWRLEVEKRGYGAFHDMRAIIVSNKRESFVKIIEAGGGMVIDARPPFDGDVYATHCLIDQKTTTDLTPFITLAKQGIFCVNITFISDFLYRNINDPRDGFLPELIKYYRD